MEPTLTTATQALVTLGGSLVALVTCIGIGIAQLLETLQDHRRDR